MKKLLATIGIILSIGLMPTITQAQVDFGIRGGVNFATLRNTEMNLESRIGLLLGAYVNFQIPNSQFSIQPEVLYSQKGAQNEGITLKLGYIEIPVLVKYDFRSGSNIVPHIYVGPYVGINVNADQEFEGGGESGSADVSDEIKNIDFGAVAGIGIDINRFNIGVRYSLGLTPVFEDDGEGEYDDDAKNGVLSIVVGFEF